MNYKSILAVVVSLIVIFGAGFGAFTYFAKASEVHELKLVMNYNFLEIRARALQERMWNMEKQYGFRLDKWPVKARQEYIKLQGERNAILKKLEIIYAEQQKKKKG
jgi:hypothetical protein